jgi:hypothetical protein
VPAAFFSALAVAIAREQTRWIASREPLRTVVVEREFSPLRRNAFGFTLFVSALGESRGHVSTLEIIRGQVVRVRMIVALAK